MAALRGFSHVKGICRQIKGLWLGGPLTLNVPLILLLFACGNKSDKFCIRSRGIYFSSTLNRSSLLQKLPPKLDSSLSYSTKKKKRRLIRPVLQHYSSFPKALTPLQGKQKLNLFRQLSISRHGLIDDKYRKEIWPFIAKYLTRGKTDCAQDMDDDMISINSELDESVPIADAELPSHSEWSQVIIKARNK